MSGKINKKYYIIITLVFLASILFGYVAGTVNSQYAKDYIAGSMKDSENIKGLSNFYVFLYIFINNSLSALLSIFVGLFLGVFPVYFTWTNGALLGFFLAIMSSWGDLRGFLVGILPHGVIELPTIIIATSYGLWLGIKFYRRIFYGEKEELIAAIKLVSIQYFKLVVPLLLIAALIETYVTPKVMDFF